MHTLGLNVYNFEAHMAKDICRAIKLNKILSLYPAMTCLYDTKISLVL